MLLIKMSSLPKSRAGRRMAWEMAAERSSSSSLALPRKYSSGESSELLVMLTWTIRSTPALTAQGKRVLLFSTAPAKVNWLWLNRTQ